MIHKGQLTDEVIDVVTSQLSQAGVSLLVGDAMAPREGGWTGGQPGSGSFKPYIVITGSTATKHFQDAIGHGSASWQVPYMVRGVGGSRQQADWALDRSRDAFAAMKNAILQLPDRWQISKVDYGQLGSPAPNTSVDPPYWEATDGVSLWLEAGRR